jgi:hypothetical protein
MDKMEGPPEIFIDFTSPDPPEQPSQNTDVARPAQKSSSLGQSQLDTTNIKMSSDKPVLFRPPAFTLDLFNNYVDGDDDTTIEEEPGGKSTPSYSTLLSKTSSLKITVLSSAQKSDSHTLLPGFSTPEKSKGTPPSDAGGLFVKADNEHNDNSDGDGCNYDDDDEVGVFARRTKRSRPFHPYSNPVLTTSRVPTLTQQGHRLPKQLRGGYRRGQQDMIMGGEYQDVDYTPTSSRRSSTQSYGRVHTTLPATNLIPTGGGGYLVTNSFMTSAQRRRLEQQENIEKILTDLEECLAACPTDYRLRAKQLHLEEFRRRLEKPESTVLKGQEAALIKDVEKMLQRRRMNMVKAEFESQARAMVENMSSAGTQGRKRAYDQAMGSLSPLSSNWSETVAPSERSSISYPSTGGKTVGPAYYQQRKRGRIVRDLEDEAEADDENENNKDEDEDLVWDDGQERKTYGGKTIARENMVSLDDDEMAKLLQGAVEEESEGNKDEGDKDSGDDVAESGEDDTDDERDIGDKGRENDEDNAIGEDDTDEENVTGGEEGEEDNENGNDEEDEDEEEQKEDENGGNGDANE